MSTWCTVKALVKGLLNSDIILILGSVHILIWSEILWSINLIYRPDLFSFILLLIKMQYIWHMAWSWHDHRHPLGHGTWRIQFTYSKLHSAQTGIYIDHWSCTMTEGSKPSSVQYTLLIGILLRACKNQQL